MRRLSPYNGKAPAVIIYYNAKRRKNQVLPFFQVMKAVQSDYPDPKSAVSYAYAVTCSEWETSVFPVFACFLPEIQEETSLVTAGKRGFFYEFVSLLLFFEVVRSPQRIDLKTDDNIHQNLNSNKKAV